MSQSSPPPSPGETAPLSWLAAIIESSDDAIVSKTLEGIVTTWNKGAERIFGFLAEEIIGQSILKIIPPDRLQEETMILARLGRGERVDHFETIRQRKDGTLVDVSVTISPIRDPSGKVVGVSKIARDVTAQKQIMRELDAARSAAEIAKERAEAANASKDHFLSVLSHELRTPLAPALGAISLIEQDPAVPASLREQLHMIRRNVETEARLVDDLLDVTRISRGKLRLHFEQVDIHAVIRNVLAMFQPDIDKKSLAVTLALRAKDSHVWADPGRLQQVLLNLISNAVKFTPNEGTITIRSINRGGDVRVEVADTGIGMEPDVLQKLFKPFEQGERTITRQFGGLGLGLSIVRSLIEMHSGVVSASSPGKDKGATFAVTLAAMPYVPQPQNSSSSNPGEPLNCKVLLVEDHDDTRNVMMLLLRRFGCTVSVASTVQEAGQIAQNEKFDVLISDMGLPDGSGIDVMNKLRQHQEIKGIAVTGFGQDEDIRKSHEAGFTTHLVKPINSQMLKRAIEEAVS